MSAPANSRRFSPDLSQDLTRAADALKEMQIKAAQSNAMTGHPPAMFGAGGPM